jgi:hypothetical protein
MDTKKKLKHTPIPWEVPSRNIERVISSRPEVEADIICDAPSMPKSLENWEANSAFIVEACNNYERVKQLNEEMRAALEQVYSVLPTEAEILDYASTNGGTCSAWGVAARMVREAITKANKE